jgi:hypothetical protein
MSAANGNSHLRAPDRTWCIIGWTLLDGRHLFLYMIDALHLAAEVPANALLSMSCVDPRPGTTSHMFPDHQPPAFIGSIILHSVAGIGCQQSAHT